MAIFAIRNGNESNESLQHRFKRQFTESGLAKKLRGDSRFSKKPSKRLVRQKALKREENRDKNRKRKFYSNM